MTIQFWQRSNHIFLSLLAAIYVLVLINQANLAPIQGPQHSEWFRRQQMTAFTKKTNRLDQLKRPFATEETVKKKSKTSTVVTDSNGGRVTFKNLIVKGTQRQQQIATFQDEEDDAHIIKDYEKQMDYRNCQYNQPFPRPQHACVTDPVTEIPYCQIERLYMDVSKIHMESGGEPLTSVMGRAEEPEFPKYDMGAFATTAPISSTGKTNQYFYISDVLKNMQVVTDLPKCERHITGQTLLITRYEYCNLYHTMTDWFNAFLAMPEKATIIFLDGHAQGNLDPVWSTLWGTVLYAKQLPKTVCFDHVTLIPPGYSSVLWSRGRSFTGYHICPSMMQAFVHFVVQGYGLQDVAMQRGKVTIIDRIPYLAHPRSKPTKAERLLQNFAQVADAVRTIDGVTTVEIVRFENMTFAEQISTIRSTHILIGNHGAGLAHLLFLQDDATVLEFEKGASHMFVQFAKWKPRIRHLLLPGIMGNQISKGIIDNNILPTVKSVVKGGVPSR